MMVHLLKCVQELFDFFRKKAPVHSSGINHVKKNVFFLLTWDNRILVLMTDDHTNMSGIHHHIYVSSARFFFSKIEFSLLYNLLPQFYLIDCQNIEKKKKGRVHSCAPLPLQKILEKYICILWNTRIKNFLYSSFYQRDRVCNATPVCFIYVFCVCTLVQVESTKVRSNLTDLSLIDTLQWNLRAHIF